MSKRALISVSDKTGIAPCARALIDLGYEIISTGGTASLLQKEKISVTPIERVTGFPECFGGRVKTMHPTIMGGILFNRSEKDHVKQAKELKIEPIDVVVVNLYPFQQTVDTMKQKGDIHSAEAEESIIEQVDIGGPTLLRSAAKNHDSVTVLCDPADYDRVIDALKSNGETSIDLRRELAAKVFVHTAGYDALIAEYMTKGTVQGLILKDGRTLRYGENPHQWGKFFSFDLPESQAPNPNPNPQPWTVHQGKELSYLNILDSDAAWQMACEFTDPTAVFVKHANPSGIASHTNIAQAFQAAYDTDRVSAFGVIIALNRPCTEEIAKKVLDQKIFTEIILAPSFEKAALDVLKTKPNLRLIEVPQPHSPLAGRSTAHGAKAGTLTQYRSAFGGMLVQNADAKMITEADLKIVTTTKPTKEQINDLLFAWKVVKHAKSNAIVFAKDSITVGIGTGQTSRVDATWIAAKRAGDRAKGAVMSSDAFFPFPDSLKEAAAHGISAIIQPGGSIRDAEVIEEANRLGVAMVCTGVRAFRH